MDAWYTTALDMEECPGSEEDDHVQIFVADVVQSFDTADRNILDCMSGRLGQPGWFRHVYFEFHACFRLRFKLAAGIGEAWRTRDGGIPHSCPLSMVFIVALYLYADNVQRVSSNSDALLDAARISNQYILAVGQSAAPTTCVLLSTCAAIRCILKSWVILGEDDHWKVE